MKPKVRATTLRRLRSSGPDESVQRILDAALASLSTQGLGGLSMSQVCRAAGVARGTLYRYFPTRAELLEALADMVRERFGLGLSAALAASADGHDPLARMHLVARFLRQYTVQVEADGLLRIEPLFVISFLSRHVDDYAALIEKALAPSFDHVEALHGHAIDRRDWAQIIVRWVLSLYLMPGRVDPDEAIAFLLDPVAGT